MTNDDETNVDIEDVNLEDFEKDFFGEAKEPEAKEDEVKEDEVEVDEDEDNSLAAEDEDAEEVEEDEEEDEEPEPKPEPKPKKNRAQERIEKLVAEARQAERERDALRIELERIRAEKPEVKKEEEAPQLRENLPADAPNPDAKDKDGNAVYELGEFDPKFIRDLTRFTIEQETKAAKEKAEQEARQAQIEAAQKEIQSKWTENLNEVEKEIPEIRDNIKELVETFQSVEPNYGEYLASVVMSSDFGPQIMNYLSQNIGEAQKIVASGPAAATLAIGRLEAKFVKSPEVEEKRNTKVVSKAAEPPSDRARGLHGRFAVAPDTPDLDAFEREFFK